MNPAVATLAVLVVGYLLLAATSIGSGLVVTHLLVNGFVGHWDGHVNEWFANHRTKTWNDTSAYFTLLANTLGVVVVAVVVTVVLLVRRWGRFALLLITGLAIELAVFLSTTYLVARPRPARPASGQYPVDLQLAFGPRRSDARPLWRNRVTGHGRNREATSPGCGLDGCSGIDVRCGDVAGLSRRTPSDRHDGRCLVGCRRPVGRRPGHPYVGRLGGAPARPRVRSDRARAADCCASGGRRMTCVGVIAHQKKTLGGGLTELRRLLADRGVTDPIWYEVPKTSKAPAMARKAVDEGADLLLLWGGDGTVQACIDGLAESDATLAIMPAGTANLLATNLGIPIDLAAAVDIALYGARRRLDVGVLNGERFAVMAGAGLDAIMMKEAEGRLKNRFGRLAYVWTGARATRAKATKMSIKVDGSPWFKGRASCLLLGNMGTLAGGLTAFPDARPDDGLLEIGVVTAQGAAQWVRILIRLATGHADRSKLVHMTRGREVDVKLDRATAYELDGGARPSKRRLRATVEPGRDHRVRARNEQRVSTATLVPETRDLSGDDAWAVLRRIGRVRLLKDAFQRMRVADGFSHARSIAFMTALVAVQGIIGLVGLASALNKGGISDVIVATIRRAVPGPAGQVLTTAVVQAHTTAVRTPLQRRGRRPDRLPHHRDDGDGPARARAQPHLRRRAGPAKHPQVRPGVHLRGERRHARLARLRLPRVRPGVLPHQRQPWTQLRLVGRALAVRPGAHGRGDHRAVSLVTSALPAATVVAGVRSRRVRGPVGRRNWPASGSSFGSARPSARPTGRWPA